MFHSAIGICLDGTSRTCSAMREQTMLACTLIRCDGRAEYSGTHSLASQLHESRLYRPHPKPLGLLLQEDASSVSDYRTPKAGWKTDISISLLFLLTRTDWLKRPSDATDTHILPSCGRHKNTILHWKHAVARPQATNLLEGTSVCPPLLRNVCTHLVARLMAITDSPAHAKQMWHRQKAQEFPMLIWHTALGKAVVSDQATWFLALVPSKRDSGGRMTEERQAMLVTFFSPKREHMPRWIWLDATSGFASTTLSLVRTWVFGTCSFGQR